MKRNYQAELTGTAVGFAALILWYFSSLAIDKAVTPSSFQYFAAFCTAAFGAFFGSYCAFKLRKHEETQNKTDKQKAALNNCLFTLVRQNNALKLIKEGYDAYKTKEEKAFSMPALKNPEYKDIKIDFESLSFLGDHGEIQTLLELTIEQERFEQTLHSIQIRNQFCLEKLQPTMESKGLNGRKTNPIEIRSLLGELIYTTALRASNSAYEMLELNCQSTNEMQCRLYKIAKGIYPDSKFISAEGKATSHNPASPAKPS